MEEIKRGVLAKEGLLFVDYLKWMDSLIESQRAFWSAFMMHSA